MFIQPILFLSSFLGIYISFRLTFYLRYLGEIPPANYLPFKNNYLLLIFIYMLAFSVTRVFKKRFRSHWELFEKIAKGMIMGMLFGFAVMYLYRSKWSSFPSSIFILLFPVGTVLVFSVNCLILRLAGRIKRKVIVLGKDSGDDAIIKDRFVEKIYINSIEELVDCGVADDLIICHRFSDDHQINLMTYLLLKQKINVVFSPALYAELIDENLTDGNSINFLATFLGKKRDGEEFLIRTLDIVCSLFAIIMAFPLFLFIAVLIKSTSNGPAFYKQQRSGKDGKIFTLVKFRTMYVSFDKKKEFMPATLNDPRITKHGAFLRKSRLDELPQLLNVLRGDMSLVGPRPENLYRVNNHKALRGIRLAIKPGLTGLAQIRSAYDLHPVHKIKYDYLYIQKRSFMLNLYILAKTIPVLLKFTGM